MWTSCIWRVGSRKDFHTFPLESGPTEKISAKQWSTVRGHRLLILNRLHSITLQTINEGHFGAERMQLRAKEAVFWPMITSDMLQTVQSCKVCQIFSRSQQWETLIPREMLQRPWEKIGIDFIEFQLSNYLPITDWSNRFPVLRRIRSTTANATIGTMKQVFSEYGSAKDSDIWPWYTVYIQSSSRFLQASIPLTTSHPTQGTCRTME